MTFHRIRLHRSLVPIAWALLLLQALGGGVVAMAHAADPNGGPVAIESGHTAHCSVLHDELRCALCQYAAAHVTPATTSVAPARPAPVRRRPAPATRLPHYAVRVPSAPPRAPPALS
jgi:hypothetical protein